mmetsp:Transcript_5024/g.14825  ORF Transcript_5024/g.14825 Transcript_5024/m.14825 type:complete len:320 (-) Transcript_5024:277-1236(-)
MRRLQCGNLKALCLRRCSGAARASSPHHYEPEPPVPDGLNITRPRSSCITSCRTPAVHRGRRGIHCGTHRKFRQQRRLFIAGRFTATRSFDSAFGFTGHDTEAHFLDFALAAFLSTSSVKGFGSASASTPLSITARCTVPGGTPSAARSGTAQVTQARSASQVAGTSLVTAVSSAPSAPSPLGAGAIAEKRTASAGDGPSPGPLSLSRVPGGPLAGSTVSVAQFLKPRWTHQSVQLRPLRESSTMASSPSAVSSHSGASNSATPSASRTTAGTTLRAAPQCTSARASPVSKRPSPRTRTRQPPRGATKGGLTDSTVTSP